MFLVILPALTPLNMTDAFDGLELTKELHE
jgi:hypothetical protein